MYKNRQEQLLNKIAEGVIILPSAKLQTRSNDTEYPFRQESNFYYFTQFLEDNATLILIKTQESIKRYLFVQKKEPQLELWSGKRLGIDAAKEQYDYDDIYDSEIFEEKLEKFLSGMRNVYFNLYNQTLCQSILKLTQKLKSNRSIKISPNSMHDINPLTQQMRLIKSEDEIQTIKKALAITKEAHLEAMKQMIVGAKEYEIQALYEYIFKKNGAYSDAYTTIVAGGENANTLHYIKNQDTLKEHDLVLIDAGCEYNMYASDITRTFPVNGKFTPAQRDLYEMVLNVQLEVIDAIKVGMLKSELQKLSEELLCEGMIELGILEGEKETLLKEKAHKKYYPHGIGHWMGIDVHDDAAYYDENGKEIPFAAGMIITIEPGIYLPENDTNIPSKYRGIGIRIEDDILIQKYKVINLSADIVKSVKEIENLMKKT